MSYRRFYNHKRRYKANAELEQHHAHSDTYYLRNPEHAANIATPEGAKAFNIDKENFSDGVNMRFKVIEPTVTVKNYTSDVPPDKRTICKTCFHSKNPRDINDGFYRVWCNDAFRKGGNAEKREPTDSKFVNNGCRDWRPKNVDCIG